MTLAKFLLARIAEGEERLVHDFDCERFNVRDYGSRQGDCDCDATDRLLAECEAKRRIVGWAVLPEDEPVLYFLAAVYADHPEYRAEWKP